MIKVAILDDFQDAFRQIVDLKEYRDKYEFEIFFLRVVGNVPLVDAELTSFSNQSGRFYRLHVPENYICIV